LSRWPYTVEQGDAEHGGDLGDGVLAVVVEPLGDGGLVASEPGSLGTQSPGTSPYR
jgi:hypothetical protein